MCIRDRLECAVAGAGIALARAPATNMMIDRLGLEACISEFSVKGSEHYNLLHHENLNNEKEINLFIDWLISEVQKCKTSNKLK